MLIVDAEPVVLLGLAALFGSARHYHVVAQATSAEQALVASREHRPDVVLLDANLAVASSVMAARGMLADDPGVRVIMFGSVANPYLAVAGIHAGIHGYLLKGIDAAGLLDAIEVVAGGGFVFDEAVTAAVLQWLRAGRPAVEPMERLSDQERRIVRLIAQGKTNRQIAAALELSEYTVKTYVSAALKKLGLTRRAGAAAFFAQREQDTLK